MNSFDELKLSKQLINGIADLGFEKPTPIQQEAFSVILSGKDVVGIAQTGTGKTYAYMLPILQGMKYSQQRDPLVLILVPTRELVLQMVTSIESLAKYISVRVMGVYGGTNINTQKQMVAKGCDILVATPGRLYDLALTGVLVLRGIRKLVIDEVDIMLDLGFRVQLANIFEYLPKRRQNLMFSATMTEDVDALLDDYFVVPQRIAIALSGTPLDNIAQQSYLVPNFYTKINLLAHLLSNPELFSKVLVFVSSKKRADLLAEKLMELHEIEPGVIHSNKSQNYRIRSITQFDSGQRRVLVATDVMARGLDLDKISHVINFDTPNYPENYMHRIGRTGRAEEQGKTILFSTEKEAASKTAIESLMDYEIPVTDFPEAVEVSEQLTADERPKTIDISNPHRNQKKVERGEAFHEKKDKNKKENRRRDYQKERQKKYGKPQRRGDKIQNMRSKKNK